MRSFARRRYRSGWAVAATAPGCPIAPTGEVGAARVPTARAAPASTSATTPGRRARGCAAMELDGVADAGFGPGAHAFAHIFEALGEIGGALAVYHRGGLVVDLAGGT